VAVSYCHSSDHEKAEEQPEQVLAFVSSMRIRDELHRELSGSRDLHFPSQTGWLGDGIAKLAQCIQMPLDRFANVELCFFQRAARSHTTRKIRHVSSPVRWSLLKNYCVLDVHFFSSNPADLRIAFSVPIGMSSPGLPGTVTTCGFSGCLKWRWLPVVLTCFQPSNSISRIKSRTFTASSLQPVRSEENP